MPFLTIVVELVLGETITPRQKQVELLGAIGVGGLIFSSFIDASFNSEGMLMMQFAAISWAAGAVYLKRNPVQLPSEVATSWILLIGAVVIAPALAWEAPALDTSRIQFAQLAAFLYATVIGMTVCQVLWMQLLRERGAVESGLVLLGIPPVGVLTSMWPVAAPISMIDLLSLAFLLYAG